MTVLSRGARVRRGGRRPGWLLLTALLVLAIAASSALVFTNRVELLKLAVILALWAAVVAAFVSVIYRRQSDVDQARVRDLKLVYDLQLDREISARREYELTVESQLRRELASELRAQAADELAALRAELSALRTNLEILFDTDLNHRPALETERGSVRGYSEWDRETESPRERINRVASVRAEEASRRSDDSSIIDVPEEPLVPPPRHDYQDPYRPPFEPASPYRGAQWPQPERQAPADQSSPPPPSAWAPQERYEAEPPPYIRPRHEASAPPPPEPRYEPAPPPTPPPPTPPPPTPPPPASDWQPVSSARQWQPPESPGSSWVAGTGVPSSAPEDTATAAREPTLATPPPAERRGRHATPAEPTPAAGAESGWRADESGGRRARHAAESTAEPPPQPPHTAPVMSSPPQPAARHRSDDTSDPSAPPSGSQSVAELLARLQATPTPGGRRRRRED
ncbi:DUF6779 domain-containing protein [Mycobacterium shimoidei]|uniref:DUF6779 domain-containing protein n=1 Tax=Mycobacterium shimoidei TaxID=29313 RepID=A0A1E3TJI4_MYCSH|nr:DUF6779 domain-containing protein [Mycobacterium shimoidei]MCV7259509.1 hypothetical protein [Mycobacterium shimoidei]ODR14624.1 hypothetical protein BHQ16_04080 [Mycobacterium shimoidei]ORW80989.1 hypothetical protein AWC26_08980 [Mycobacterium shimoidei]SRX93292.1 hypothetical protein MSP7336_01529 [Mycobacterium shimoidei]